MSLIRADTSYFTQQRDMFTSGLAARIGVNAYAIWSAIKYDADFESGESTPEIKRLQQLTGLSSMTVRRAIDVLEKEHLLRVKRVGKRHSYVARERIDIAIGPQLLCTVVVDYVPVSMRQRLENIQRTRRATEQELLTSDIWAYVEIIPGDGFEFNEQTRTFSKRMRADQVAITAGPASTAELLGLEGPDGVSEQALERLASVRERIRAKN